MDFVKGLPHSCSYFSILVVIVRLSKFSDFTPLTHPFTAKQVVEQFVDQVATIHNMQESIITNCGSVFLNGIWREFVKL